MRFRFSLLLFLLALSFSFVQAKPRKIKISVEPKEASIYVNNVFVGNGFAEFQIKGKKNIAIIRCECE